MTNRVDLLTAAIMGFLAVVISLVLVFDHRVPVVPANPPTVNTAPIPMPGAGVAFANSLPGAGSGKGGGGEAGGGGGLGGGRAGGTGRMASASTGAPAAPARPPGTMGMAKAGTG